MNNKKNYIMQVDNITAPDSLKESIKSNCRSEIKPKKTAVKVLSAIAACLIVIIGITAVGSIGMEKTSYDTASESENYYSESNVQCYTKTEAMSLSDSAENDVLTYGTESTRKIIKNAELYVQTKDYNKFITDLNEKINTFEGYTDSLNENNYSNKSASIVVRIPAENLEKFLSGVEKIGTIQSKNISKTDVTDSYIDIESHITALDTEEKALLKILENCKTVSETIEVQSRLSEVRAEAEKYKSQKKDYDSKISYSTVTIEITEEERIIKSNGTFSSQLKEKFNDSIYNIGNFFKTLALTILGDILYILIIGAIAAVVVVIIKKKKKKREN